MKKKIYTLITCSENIETCSVIIFLSFSSFHIYLKVLSELNNMLELTIETCHFSYYC